MDDTRIPPGGVATGRVGYLDRAYVDWAAVVGGSVVATAIFSTLTIFGTGIGLSLTSTTTGSGFSAAMVAAAIGLWSAWVAVSSFMAGGFIAGRLRHRIAEASVGEVEMRDGLHGLVSWGLAAIVSGLLVAYAASGIAHASGANGSASAVATAENYQLNRLFRGQKADDEVARGSAKSVLDVAVGGKDISGDDRTYLSELVASRTGVPAATANGRVDEAAKAIKDSVNGARRAGVLAAFLTAVSLALGAAGAWWAAIRGGKHRDDGSLFSPFTRWH
jgi:hypothetical protein